jgi:hypothetical protein
MLNVHGHDVHLNSKGRKDAGNTQGTLAGGCQCGAVRYAVSGDRRQLYVCHCRECQKQSASAFGISLDVPRAGLSLVRGTPKFWSRATDSGHTLKCTFCPECGSRLWHEGDRAVDRVSIKGGSLDEPVDLRLAIHIWTQRKLPGVLIPPRATQFPAEPD